MKKTTCILLTAISLISVFLFFSCDSGTLPADTETSELTETEAAADTSQETVINHDLLPLVTDGKPNFCFVYQKENIPDGMTSYNYSKIANNLAIGWKQKIGVEFPVYGEGKLPEEHPTPIAVGRVQGISDNAYSGMRYKDFAITYNDGIFVLAAMDKESIEILESRMENMLVEKNGSFYLDIGKIGEPHKERYKLSSITAGGIDIEEFFIQYGDSEKETAEEFKALVTENVGLSLPAGKESSNSKRIVFRSDSTLSGYEITHSGTEYIFRYNPGIPERLMMKYISELFAKQERGTAFSLESLENVYTTDWDRSIITYNVKNVYTKNGSPSPRDITTAGMLMDYKPDFFCLQEFDPGYRNASNGLLSIVSAAYSEVPVDGVKPDDIWNPVFYLTDKYELVKSGYYNLRLEAGAVESTTYFGNPDGLSSFRTMIWAVLKDKNDGSVFVIANTHCTPNKATHVSEAAFIYSAVSKISEGYPGCVTFLTGDLNSGRTAATGAVAQLCTLGFKDTYDTAAIRTDTASYHDWGAAPGNSYLSNGIDHILTFGGIESKVYLNLSKASLWNTSDHLPVVVGFK